MADIKLKQTVRDMGNNQYYVRIPKALVDSEIIKVGKKYDIVLRLLGESEESKLEKCETE